MSASPTPRLLTPAEYAALTSAQRQAFGLEETSEGAPTDFNGPVFPNPDHLRPQLDTDSAIPVTRLPTGVSFQKGNWKGTLPMDVSNPPATDVIPAMGRTVGATMSGQAIDFSKYEAAAPASAPATIDFSKYEAAAPPPQPSAFQRLGESALSGAGVVSNEQGKNFFLHPVDTLRAMANQQGALGERAQKELANKDYVRGLTHGVEWLIPGLGPTLAHSGDQLEAGDIAGGAGTTLGAAATLLAGAKGPAIAEGVGDAASAAAAKGAAAVRAATRGANIALQKAPGTIGGTVGAAAGGAVAGHIGAEVGGAAGAMAGKELLPALRIPGEGFGFPNRVAGGPTVAPKFVPGEAGSLADSVAAPAAETPAAITPAEAETPQPGSGAGLPRTLSGESALRDVLSRQDNANLTRIAKARGINISQESQLKPSVADGKLINKIVDDHTDEELDNLRDTYMENTRMPRHDFGDVGAEANKTLAMQTYFPDVKIPATVMKRTQTAIAAAKASSGATAPVDDLTALLQESLKRAQQQKQVALQ